MLTNSSQSEAYYVYNIDSISSRVSKSQLNDLELAFTFYASPVCLFVSFCFVYCIKFHL